MTERNKTIRLTEEEKKLYLARCLKIEKEISLPEVLDKTLLGDTLKIMDFLPKAFVDLLIVDPPYNMEKNFGGNKFKKTTEEEYEEYTEKWIEKAKPLLKENASIYVCCDWESGMVIGNVLKRHFNIKNRITWQREKGRGAKGNWKNGMEDIWFATFGKDYTFNVDDVKMRRRVMAPYKKDGEPKDWEETKDGNFRNTYPSNFWDDLSVPYWSMAENTPHPTQKPEKLLAKLILASSNEGDVIFDPFLGSGTTSVVAKKLKRHFIGIEKNEDYAAICEKRLEMADKDKTIQGYSDGVFWERNTKVQQLRYMDKK